VQGTRVHESTLLVLRRGKPPIDIQYRSHGISNWKRGWLKSRAFEIPGPNAREDPLASGCWREKPWERGWGVYCHSSRSQASSLTSYNASFFLCDTIAWFVQKLSLFPFQQHKNSETMFFLTWVKHKCNTFPFNRSTALLKSLLLRSYWQNSL